MNEQQSSESGASASNGRTTPPVNRIRRRLGKAALATPVIASLAARPAMACSMSGFLSGNTSPGRTPYSCGTNGCTPGFWKNNPQVWKKTPYSAGYCADGLSAVECDKAWVVDGTTLLQILDPNFGNSPFAAAPNSSEFLLQILLNGVKGGGFKDNNYAFVCHYIAAVLNASSAESLYGSSAQQIISGLWLARQSGKLTEYKDILVGLNERNCMFDAHGNFADGFVSNGTTAAAGIPACKRGFHYDFVTKVCVRD